MVIDNNTEPTAYADIFDEPDESFVPKIINISTDEDLADKPVQLVEKSQFLTAEMLMFS